MFELSETSVSHQVFIIQYLISDISYFEFEDTYTTVFTKKFIPVSCNNKSDV